MPAAITFLVIKVLAIKFLATKILPMKFLPINFWQCATDHKVSVKYLGPEKGKKVVKVTQTM